MHSYFFKSYVLFLGNTVSWFQFHFFLCKITSNAESSLTLIHKKLDQGVHPSIRGQVWEFLLGCFDPKSTFEEREELRQQRRYDITDARYSL